MMKILGENPKTTLYGILMFLAMVVTQIATYFDGDPVTLPDWGLIVTMLMAMLGLGAAADGKSKTIK